MSYPMFNRWLFSIHPVLSPCLHKQTTPWLLLRVTVMWQYWVLTSQVCVCQQVDILVGFICLVSVTVSVMFPHQHWVLVSDVAIGYSWLDTLSCTYRQESATFTQCFYLQMTHTWLVGISVLAQMYITWPRAGDNEHMVFTALYVNSWCSYGQMQVKLTGRWGLLWGEVEL